MSEALVNVDFECKLREKHRRSLNESKSYAFFVFGGLI